MAAPPACRTAQAGSSLLTSARGAPPFEPGDRGGQRITTPRCRGRLVVGPREQMPRAVRAEQPQLVEPRLAAQRLPRRLRVDPLAVGLEDADPHEDPAGL